MNHPPQADGLRRQPGGDVLGDGVEHLSSATLEVGGAELVRLRQPAHIGA